MRQANGWTLACVTTICLTVGTIFDMLIRAGAFR